MEIEKNGFSLEKNVGGGVGFTDMHRTGDSWTGVAQRFDANGPVLGKVTGQITLTSFDLTVTWPDGSGGKYTGTIGPDGKAQGQTTDAIFGIGGITSVAPLKCIADPECKLYADIATEKATEFKNLRCGGPYEGRWTADHRQHSDWCMGQPLGSPSIGSEADARTTELDACKARVAGCDDFAKEGVAMGTEFLKLNCGELPIPLSTDFDQQKGLCLNTPTESFMNSGAILARRRSRTVSSGSPRTRRLLPQRSRHRCRLLPRRDRKPARSFPSSRTRPPSPCRKATVSACRSRQSARIALAPTGANSKSRCKIQARIRSAGSRLPTPPTGDGELDLPADSFAVNPQAPWSCAKGSPTRCTLAQPLAPGEKKEFNIGFKPGARRPPRR